MTAEDPYKNSPYDASGMPLGAITIDYDNEASVAAHTVYDKPTAPPMSINDIDYTPAAIEDHLLTEVDPANFNTAVSQELPLFSLDEVDFLEEDK